MPHKEKKDKEEKKLEKQLIELNTLFVVQSRKTNTRLELLENKVRSLELEKQKGINYPRIPYFSGKH